ncbi:MAG: glycosyltransferase family 2 protein [Clostridiales bacterium]|nr:glycosyltransferase family 2 protein [Clostridiales bacterium]
MKVQVLLSAYNGEKFITEQINSILSQKGIDVSLLIRDDGSTDGTASVLDGFKDKISYYSDKNIGVKRSFFDLVQKAPDADFYAFADQDDFWLPDKLSSAAEMLKNAKGCGLYFSNLTVADENLKPVSTAKLKFKPGLGSAMSQNPATGCTMVFNRAMLDVLRKTPEPDKVSMHDTFLYRLASAVNAEIFFDKTPHILYRQHSSNLLGNRSLRGRLAHYFSFFIKNKCFSRSDEAALLLRTAQGQIPTENLALLTQIIAYKYSNKTTFRLLTSGKLKTPSCLTNLIVAAAVILRKY